LSADVAFSTSADRPAPRLGGQPSLVPRLPHWPDLGHQIGDHRHGQPFNRRFTNDARTAITITCRLSG